MCTNTLSNNIECGRVYINKTKTIQFRIQCLLCISEFNTWSLFTAHICLAHEDSSSNLHLEEKPYEVHNQNKRMTYKQEINNPESTGIGSMDEHTEYAGESFDEEVMPTKGNLSPNCVLDKVCDPQSAPPAEEQIVNLVVEILPSFAEGDHKQKKNTKKAHGQSSSEREIYDEFGEPGRNHSQKKIIKSTPRCFFQLRTTDQSVILGFIDIIRRHPCHWNTLDHDYGHKDKRDESLTKICRDLKQFHKISISPKLARSSILSMIRWFEREYIRSVYLNKSKIMSKRGRWSRKGYICAHPTYFNKLFQFLPHKHLQLVRCETCQRKFKTQTQLSAHNHHAHGGDAPFNCRHCKRSFLHASTWKHHENRHTKTRIWSCPLCSYISSTKTDYNIHMVTHSDVRAYICYSCGASYKSSTSLNVHIRTHEAPKLECSLCNKKFYEKYRLKRHLMIHEAEEAVMQCHDIPLFSP